MKRSNEIFDVLMGLGLRNEFFGRGTPDHHQPIAIILPFETLDIGPNGLHCIQFRARCFDIGPVDSPDVVVVEDGWHWLYRPQEVGYGFHLFISVQNTRVHRRVIGVVGDRVPGPENHLVQARQGNEVPYERRPLVGSLPEANGSHLRHRPHRLSRPLLDMLDACDKGGCHRPQPHHQYPQFSVGWADFRCGCRYKVLWFQDDPFLMCKFQ